MVDIERIKAQDITEDRPEPVIITFGNGFEAKLKDMKYYTDADGNEMIGLILLPGPGVFSLNPHLTERQQETIKNKGWFACEIKKQDRIVLHDSNVYRRWIVITDPNGFDTPLSREPWIAKYREEIIKLNALLKQSRTNEEQVLRQNMKLSKGLYDPDAIAQQVATRVQQGLLQGTPDSQGQSHDQDRRQPRYGA